MSIDERVLVLIESDNRTVVVDVEETVVGSSSGEARTVVVDANVDDGLIVVEPTGRPSDVIRLLLPGPPGDAGEAGQPGEPGAPGQPGVSGGNFVHVQSAPVSVWTINHNLGYPPSITVIDTLGRVVLGEIAHPTVNRTVLTFSAAFSGTAYLS